MKWLIACLGLVALAKPVSGAEIAEHVLVEAGGATVILL